jgi:hypothetical protein
MYVVAWIVKAVHYKPEGLFRVPIMNRIFLNYLILPPAIALGFIQPLIQMGTWKYFWGAKRGPLVGLKILPPSVSRLSRQCGFLDISQTYRLPRPVKGIALLYGDGVCFLWGTKWTVSTATSSQCLISYLWTGCLDNVGSLTTHNPIGLHDQLLE